MTSMLGNRIGMPHSRSNEVLICGLPSTTTANSQVVPPMSMHTALATPADSAMAAPAMTPAAGPEFSVLTAWPLA